MFQSLCEFGLAEVVFLLFQTFDADMVYNVPQHIFGVAKSLAELDEDLDTEFGAVVENKGSEHLGL